MALWRSSTHVYDSAPKRERASELRLCGICVVLATGIVVLYSGTEVEMLVPGLRFISTYPTFVIQLESFSDLLLPTLPVRLCVFYECYPTYLIHIALRTPMHLPYLP